MNKWFSNIIYFVSIAVTIMYVFTTSATKLTFYSIQYIAATEIICDCKEETTETSLIENNINLIISFAQKSLSIWNLLWFKLYFISVREGLAYKLLIVYWTVYPFVLLQFNLSFCCCCWFFKTFYVETKLVVNFKQNAGQ